jgi:hypothetical protein
LQTPKEAGVEPNFNVISNGSITLKDGTEVCRIEIRWFYKNGKV